MSTNAQDTVPLIIVMPAYNEAECIDSVTGQWLAELDRLNLPRAKLLVINDGSKDRTGEILDQLAKTNSRLLVVHQQNGGHGRALRHGYDRAVAAGAEWVFHVDSDDQFVSSDLETLWAMREQSNFILGFRQKRFDALHRLVITRILKTLNILLFGIYIRDANVPFRLIRGAYLRTLLQLVPPTVFAPNIFLAVLAAKDGQNLMSVPVQHKERETGVVSIVRWRLIKACLRCVGELWQFRLGLPKSLRVLKVEREKLGLKGI